MISIHASLYGYNLPKRGWLKPCVYCECITSNVLKLDSTYQLYICPECKKKYNYDDIKNKYLKFTMEKRKKLLNRFM